MVSVDKALDEIHAREYGQNDTPLCNNELIPSGLDDTQVLCVKTARLPELYGKLDRVLVLGRDSVFWLISEIQPYLPGRSTHLRDQGSPARQE